MSAPTRWRDKLGREWVQCPWISSAAYTGNSPAPEFVELVGGPRIAYDRRSVNDICGPLEPVEPMARVRVLSTEARTPFRYVGSTSGKIGVVVAQTDAVVWPRQRAEEIAAALRTLGYTDATVEPIHD